LQRKESPAGASKLLWAAVANAVLYSSFQPILLGKFACYLPTLVGIRRGQANGKPPAVNLKSKTALFIIVGLPAQIGMLCCILCQPLFERGIVCLDFNGFAGFVKIDAGRFLPFGQSGFHVASISACSVKTGAFSRFFVSSTLAKTG